MNILSPFEVYCILKLDTLVNLGIVFSLILGGIVVALWIAYHCYYHDGIGYDEEDRDVKIAKRIRPQAICTSIILVILIVATALIPTTKQMAAIIVLPKIVNNEVVQQIPDKILGLGLEWLNELKPATVLKEKKK
jgi:hypothetical protein